MEILITSILTLAVIVGVMLLPLAVIVAMLLIDAKSKYDCRYGWSEKGDNELDIGKFLKILFKKDRR